MEVILNKSVERLGTRGATVRVADGYARNWLLPQGIATIATAGAKRQAEGLLRSEARKEQGRRDVASSERDKVHGKAVTVRARATAAGKLYGSVTAKDICEALRQTHGLVLDPASCRMPDDHLRDVATHVVKFVFYHDIAAEVTVTVKAIEEATPAAATTPAPEEETTRRAPKPKPIITGGAVEDD